MPAAAQFETRIKMPATAQGAAHKVDLRKSQYAGRYALDGVLINNGSGATLQVRDQTGVAGEVLPSQPLQASVKPSGLSFALVPLDAAVSADQVMIFLKWRPLAADESVF